MTPDGSAGRPNRPLTPDRLADWETRTFGVLRRNRDLVTVIDDELPELGTMLEMIERRRTSAS